MKKLFTIFIILLAAVSMASTVQARGLTRGPQVIYGDKTFEHNATVKGDFTVEGATIGINEYSTVYYVCSTNGLDNSGTHGTTYLKPFATVDYAINQTTANKGDIIYVLPGHAESYTAADGFDADVAGISIIGLGTGQDTPEFTFADTDATVAIGAANVTLKNLRMLAGISEVVTGVSVEAAGDDAVIDGLFFPEPTTSTFEFDKSILLAAGADRVTIKNCIAYSADATGATNFIDLDAGVQNGTRIVGNWIYGEYAEGAIHSDDIDLDVHVWGNIVYNLTTGQHCIEFAAAALGTFGDNYCYTDAEATSYDPGSLKAVAPNWVVTAIDASPVMFPAQDDTAQNFIGANNNNNAADTSTVAANADGSILERLEQIDVDTSAIATDTAAMDTAAELQVLANTVVAEATGEADIDISESDYTGFINVMTITAPATGLLDCRIDLDLNKATTGWDTVSTAADTIDIALVGQADGTNYRNLQNATQITANGDGSLEHSEDGVSFHVGPMQANGSLQVHVKLSVERGDAELPYRVTYIGAAPTITPVAIP